MIAERTVGALRKFAAEHLTDAVWTQLTDSATDVPVAQQRQIPTVQTTQNTAQTAFPVLGQVDDMPVVVPTQDSMIQTVQIPPS